MRTNSLSLSVSSVKLIINFSSTLIQFIKKISAKQKKEANLKTDWNDSLTQTRFRLKGITVLINTRTNFFLELNTEIFTSLLLSRSCAWVISPEREVILNENDECSVTKWKRSKHQLWFTEIIYWFQLLSHWFTGEILDLVQINN